MRDLIVKSTSDIYFAIKSCKELFPIPKKAHYTYNLKDISKIFQGLSKIICYENKVN